MPCPSMVCSDQAAADRRPGADPRGAAARPAPKLGALRLTVISSASRWPAWSRMQDELAALSSDGVHMTAVNAATTSTSTSPCSSCRRSATSSSDAAQHRAQQARRTRRPLTGLSSHVSCGTGRQSAGWCGTDRGICSATVRQSDARHSITAVTYDRETARRADAPLSSGAGGLFPCGSVCGSRNEGGYIRDGKKGGYPLLQMGHWPVLRLVFSLAEGLPFSIPIWRCG